MRQSELSMKGQELAIKFRGAAKESLSVEQWFETGLMGEFYEWLVKEGKVKIAEVE